VIVDVDGKKVRSTQDIFDVIETEDLRPGDKVKMKVFRNGNYQTIKMKLGKINE